MTLLDAVRDKIRPPVAIVLGSPAEAAELVAALSLPDVVCFQFDLYQADRLRETLTKQGVQALKPRVMTAPDLWDLPPEFQTALYPSPQGGERSLKIDM